MQDSTDAASPLSREVSLVDGGDSDSESRSVSFDDELIASDTNSMKRANVATTAGITFDFSASNASKARIRVMERVSYFLKGHTRLPGLETVPTPRADEAVVFRDLFSVGLHMPLHPVLTDILLNFQKVY
jgi:hypothetical protein